jgi:hypothetical protein
MITWRKQEGNYILGDCKYGAVWLRIKDDDTVTGLYTMWPETEKTVPGDDMCDIESAKTLAVLLAEGRATAEKIISKL